MDFDIENNISYISVYDGSSESYVAKINISNGNAKFLTSPPGADCTEECTLSEINCDDQIDNDGDGNADCQDEDCSQSPYCSICEQCD